MWSIHEVLQSIKCNMDIFSLSKGLNQSTLTELIPTCISFSCIWGFNAWQGRWYNPFSSECRTPTSWNLVWEQCPFGLQTQQSIQNETFWVQAAFPCSGAILSSAADELDFCRLTWAIITDDNHCLLVKSEGISSVCLPSTNCSSSKYSFPYMLHSAYMAVIIVCAKTRVVISTPNDISISIMLAADNIPLSKVVAMLDHT